MGVVRREGDWRLEKRDEGVYELTYGEVPKVKIYTPDYRPDPAKIPAVDVLPVREADGFADVEAVFREHAGGQPPGARGGRRTLGTSR